jgi:hypothetical protein
LADVLQEVLDSQGSALGLNPNKCFTDFREAIENVDADFCGIIQNYRYARDKQELVRIRDEGRLGRLQHILGRYACDYRNYESWGRAWRYDMEFGLLFEGSVHHFDMLRFLSGGDCDTLMGFG